MIEVDQEDRVTLRRQRASEKGFTGVSVVHRLHALYGFNASKYILSFMNVSIIRVKTSLLQKYNTFNVGILAND